ncbi:MAG: hypothetical protein Rhirs2KO_18440 [Rhizobiaceae bacterium]
MASDTAFNGIRAYLEANWSTTPLIFENEEWPSDNPQHFVLVEVVGNFYDQASIGAEPVSGNLWREGGQVFLSVMTKRGTGSGTARTYAKQLVDLFRGNEEAGVRPRGMSIGAGEPGENDGNYFRMTAVIDWERDDNG